jgi:hypothetical protein
MIFFIFCAFSCKLHLLLFVSWVIHFNIFVYFSHGAVCVKLPMLIMPVVTRSQSKLLRLTGSTDWTLATHFGYDRFYRWILAIKLFDL